MVSEVRFVEQNARWNTWNAQHKRCRGTIDLSAQTARQFGFRKSQWAPTCLEKMERRNYSVHGLGNGWERRKDEGKLFLYTIGNQGREMRIFWKLPNWILISASMPVEPPNYRKKRDRAIKATSETVHHITSGNKREEKKDKRDQGGRDDKNWEPEINPKMQILWTTTSARKLPSIWCRMSKVPQIKSFRFRLHV